MIITQEEVREVLSGVMEPDLGKDLATLGLFSNVELGEGTVSLTVKVSNAAMHARERMREAVEFAFDKRGVKAQVKVEAIPSEERTPETRKVLPDVKHIIAVASGKGGVGKSTVAANIAVELVQRGYKVGLVDADIHGPSMPTMFDVVRARPGSVEHGGRQLIEPVEAHGVKLLSIGFFADPEQAIVWRGPMATKALKQMFSDAYWGELDYMIVDLPPGTGDVHLSLISHVDLRGAVVVSTPQDIALADAIKGVSMFRLDSVNVPVLGLVENMAYFTPPDLPDRKYHLFGRDGVKRFAETSKTPFLGELPLEQNIREAGDVGRPVVLQGDSVAARAMRDVVDALEIQVAAQLERDEQTATA
jgi:ATP-binding protein involved in chromosome partitioning